MLSISLRAAFKDTDSEAILLIDAIKALNSLNHDLALQNIEKIRPSLYHSMCNSYREPSNYLLINQQYSLRKVQPKVTPLLFRCMESPLSP